MNTIDEIKKLSDLKNSGAITEEEFIVLKKQLLIKNQPESNSAPSNLLNQNHLITSTLTHLLF